MVHGVSSTVWAVSVSLEGGWAVYFSLSAYFCEEVSASDTV